MAKHKEHSEKAEELVSEGLTVLEIAGLVKQLEEKWGVSAAAPIAVEVQELRSRRLDEARLRLLQILEARAHTLNDEDLLELIGSQLDRISRNLGEAFRRSAALNKKLSHA